jgi:hypothetical protein
MKKIFAYLSDFLASVKYLTVVAGKWDASPQNVGVFQWAHVPEVIRWIVYRSSAKPRKRSIHSRGILVPKVRPNDE